MPGRRNNEDKNPEWVTPGHRLQTLNRIPPWLLLLSWDTDPILGSWVLYSIGTCKLYFIGPGSTRPGEASTAYIFEPWVQ